jgi:aspartate ammonia-lyase
MRALAEKRGIRDIILEEGLLTAEQLNELLKIEAMTKPSRAGRIAKPPVTSRA